MTLNVRSVSWFDVFSYPRNAGFVRESWTPVALQALFVDLIAKKNPDNGVVQAPTVEVPVMSLAHAPGESWKARPTIYSGIQMRSRLEASFAEVLDRLAIEWVYEPRAYGAKDRRQYLPDFEIRLKDRFRFFVEVKPTPLQAFLAMERMTVIWESDPDVGLIITTPDGPSWVADSDDRTWLLIEFPWGRRL